MLEEHPTTLEPPNLRNGEFARDRRRWGAGCQRSVSIPVGMTAKPLLAHPAGEQLGPADSENTDHPRVELARVGALDLDRSAVGTADRLRRPAIKKRDGRWPRSGTTQIGWQKVWHAENFQRRG